MWDKIVIFAADNKRKEEYECSINEQSVDLSAGIVPNSR